MIYLRIDEEKIIFSKNRSIYMEAKAKILVVDDDKEIADLVEIHLVSEGYEVRKANDAVTGLAILKSEEDISLAILDIMMPGMDGLSMRPAIYL